MTPPALYTDKQSGPWILAAAKILFGTMAVVSKIIPAPVVLIVLVLHFCGGIGALPKAWPDLKKLSWQTIGRISVLGVLVATTDLTYFYAVRLMDVSVSTLLRWTAPVLLVAILLFTQPERNRRAIVATIVAFVGLLLLLYGQGLQFGTAHWLGIGLALLSASTVALFWYGSKQMLRATPPMVMLALRSLAAVVCLLPFIGDWQASLDWWPALVGFGIVYGFLVSYLDTIGIQRTSVELVGLIGYVNPLVAVLAATLLLHETITPFMAVGGGLILISGLWAQRTNS